MKKVELGEWYKRHTSSLFQCTDIYFRPDKCTKDDYCRWYEGSCIVIGKKGTRDICQIETNSKEFNLSSHIKSSNAVKCKTPFKDLNKAIKNLKSLIFNETE